jgi:uncharacterized protein YecT (DUF1311 family)
MGQAHERRLSKGVEARRAAAAGTIAHRAAALGQFRDANCLYFDMGEGTIARIDAAECMRNMTETGARELEEFGQH